MLVNRRRRRDRCLLIGVSGGIHAAGANLEAASHRNRPLAEQVVVEKAAMPVCQTLAAEADRTLPHCTGAEHARSTRSRAEPLAHRRRNLAAAELAGLRCSSLDPLGSG